MGMAKRQLEEFEELRHRLEQIAVSTRAIEYDGDADEFISNWDCDAERHAYARATILFRQGRLGQVANYDEIKDLLREILDGVRFPSLHTS